MPKIGDRVESDHHPLVVTMKEGGAERRRRKERERKIGKGKWSERMKEEYEKGMEGANIGGGGERFKRK